MGDGLFILGSLVVACCAKVARLPKAGESLHALNFSAEPGGKGFNMAVGAHRLEANVTCLSVVGNDLFGHLAISAFASAGLSTALLRTVDHASTGAGIGFIADGGENCLAVCSGANSKLGRADIEAVSDTIREAAFTIATFEHGDEAIMAAFQIARGAGKRTLLNPSPFRHITTEILALTNLLVVNESEGALLGNAINLELESDLPSSVQAFAEKLFATGVDIFVLTLGAKGAIATLKDRVLQQPAYLVQAVDTLGAGDAFVAGLASALASKRDMVEALDRGAAAGALATTKPGTFDALPYKHQVDALIGSYAAGAR